jgi:hypothetical protein
MNEARWACLTVWLRIRFPLMKLSTAHLAIDGLLSHNKLSRQAPRHL